MDSLSNQMKISFHSVKSTVDDVNARWQLLLRVVADFDITIGGREFYKEKEFPIVEFAAQANAWVHNDSGGFKYDSMESDINPLIEFRECPDNRLLPYSPHQEFEVISPIDRTTVCASIFSFVKTLRKTAHMQLHIKLDDIL